MTGVGSTSAKAQTRERSTMPDGSVAGLWFTALREQRTATNSIGSGNCLFFNNSEAVKSSGRLGQAAARPHGNST